MHNILVVGGGSIGQRHVRCLLASKRAEVSLCEVNADLLEQVSAGYPLKETFTDLGGGDLSKVDGVVICTPANLHVQQARKVVAAGVNLFCEKPLTVRDEGVKELLQEIQETGVVAGVGFTWRYVSGIREMHQQLESGVIGQLKHVGIRVGQHFPHFRPAYAEVYFASIENGGGAILDAASHQINLAQMFSGRVSSVLAMYGNSGLLKVEVEDTVDTLLLFADGGWGNIHVNLWQRPTEALVTLTGSKGSLRYVYERDAVGLCCETNGEWQEKQFKNERDDHYIAEANNFFNAIEGSEEVLCSVEEAYHTSKVCWAIRKSFDEGRRIEIED